MVWQDLNVSNIKVELSSESLHYRHRAYVANWEKSRTLWLLGVPMSGMTFDCKSSEIQLIFLLF